MKKTIRKSLALLLAVLMLLSVSPMSFATDPCETHTWTKQYSSVYVEATGKYMVTGIATCTACGESKNKVVEAEIIDESSTQPTCTTGGVLMLQARFDDDDLNAPNKSYYMMQEEVDALGHDFAATDAHHQGTPATCYAAGEKEYYFCARCEKKFDDDKGTNEITDTVISKRVHDFSPDDPSAETKRVHNVEPGKHNWKCANEGCDAYGVMKDGAPVVDGFVACDGPDVACGKQKVCADCGEPFGEVKEHVYVEHPAVEVTCVDDGNKKYYTCENCDKIFNADKEETTLDDVTIKHTKEAHTQSGKTARYSGNHETYDCTKGGYEVMICADCKAEYGAVTLPRKTAHAPTNVPQKDATCTEPGLTAHRECTECGYFITEPEVIPAKGHDYLLEGHEHAAKEPTCTEEGNLHYWNCSLCGGIFVQDPDNPTKKIEVLPDPEGTVNGKTALEKVTRSKTSHMFVTEQEAEPAKCLKDGSKEVFKCSVCGQLAVIATPKDDGTYEEDVIKIGTRYYKPITSLSDPAVIVEKLGHNWYDDKAEGHVGYKPATCSEKGAHIRYCTRCLVKQTVEDETIDHTPDKIVEGSHHEATCAEKAYDLYTCKVCKQQYKVYDDSTSPLNHVWANEVTVVVPATCKEKGWHGRKCLRDGCDAYTDGVQDIPLAAHTKVPDNLDATCDTDGYTRMKCTVCGEIFDEVKIPAGHVDENKDGYCDRCGVYISCSHICHKTDAFSKIIWFIMNLWNQFLGINETCQPCGQPHYTKSSVIDGKIPD